MKDRHEPSYGWYDRGGFIPPGLTLAHNDTGRPEKVGRLRNRKRMRAQIQWGLGYIRRIYGGH